MLLCILNNHLYFRTENSNWNFIVRYLVDLACLESNNYPNNCNIWSRQPKQYSELSEIFVYEYHAGIQSGPNHKKGSTLSHRWRATGHNMQLSIMLNAILMVVIYPPIEIRIEARGQPAGKPGEPEVLFSNRDFTY